MGQFEDNVFENIEQKKLRVASLNKEAKLEIPTITPAKLKSQMYSVISKFNSIYKDNSWQEIQKLMKSLSNILPNLNVIEAKYTHNDEGTSNGKKWFYVGAIEDNKKKKWAVMINVTAHGAGSVADPLDRYDITAVVNVLSPRQVRDVDVKDYLEQYGIE